MMAEIQEKPVAEQQQQHQDPLNAIPTELPSEITKSGTTPTESDIHLFSRVYSLPLINSTVGSIYETSKYYTPVLTSTVESSAVQLGSAVKSYEYVYIKPLKRVDDLGCRGLDSLEKNFPVITEPTEKVYQYGREYVDTQIIKPVKKIQDSVTERVTPYIDTALTKSDQFIDVILPPQQEKSTTETQGKSTETQVIKSDEDSVTISGKVYNIGSKVSGRIHSRYYNFVGPKSDEQINQMKFTVDLIHYANENLEKQAKLIGEKMEALKSYVQNTKLAQSVEKNISINLKDYRTSLQSGVDTIIEQIKSHTPNLPTELQKTISQIQEKIDVQLSKIKLTNNQQELSGVSKIAAESFSKLNDIKEYLLESIHQYTHANNNEETPKITTEEAIEEVEEEIKKNNKQNDSELNEKEKLEEKIEETIEEIEKELEETAEGIKETEENLKEEKPEKKSSFSFFSPKKEKSTKKN